MQISLENTVTKQALTFGLGDTPYAIEAVDLGQVPGQHNTTKYINLNGSHVNNTSLGERDISISGWIFAAGAAEMKERKAFLNHFFNPRQQISIYSGEHELVIVPDASVKYSTDKYENKQCLCKWLMQATAFNPLWRLRKSKIYREAKSTGVPLFPLIIPKEGVAFGYMPSASVSNVPNPGDVDAGFVVRFAAERGPVINPRITDNATGKYIEVITAMNLGDVIEVSTVPGDKYAVFIQGESRTDMIKAISKRSSMDMALSVGINDLTIDAAENTVNLTSSITFSPEWLEVQQ